MSYVKVRTRSTKRDRPELADLGARMPNKPKPPKTKRKRRRKNNGAGRLHGREARRRVAAADEPSALDREFAAIVGTTGPDAWDRIGTCEGAARC